jgi:hypothetical protein
MATNINQNYTPFGANAARLFGQHDESSGGISCGTADGVEPQVRKVNFTTVD